jgi:hypothetical protein
MGRSHDGLSLVSFLPHRACALSLLLWRALNSPPWWSSTLTPEPYVDQIVHFSDSAHVLGLFSSVYHTGLPFVCLHRPAALGVPMTIDVYGCRALKTSAPAPSMHAKTYRQTQVAH